MAPNKFKTADENKTCNSMYTEASGAYSQYANVVSQLELPPLSVLRKWSFLKIVRMCWKCWKTNKQKKTLTAHLGLVNKYQTDEEIITSWNNTFYMLFTCLSICICVNHTGLSWWRYSRRDSGQIQQHRQNPCSAPPTWLHGYGLRHCLHTQNTHIKDKQTQCTQWVNTKMTKKIKDTKEYIVSSVK